MFKTSTIDRVENLKRALLIEPLDRDRKKGFKTISFS